MDVRILEFEFKGGRNQLTNIAITHYLALLYCMCLLEYTYVHLQLGIVMCVYIHAQTLTPLQDLIPTLAKL